MKVIIATAQYTYLDYDIEKAVEKTKVLGVYTEQENCLQDVEKFADYLLSGTGKEFQVEQGASFWTVYELGKVFGKFVLFYVEFEETELK